jgi:hypothetical protein
MAVKEWFTVTEQQQRAYALVRKHFRPKGRVHLRHRCKYCGSSRNVDAHHEDYDKPLEVTWLCRSCHAKLHSILNVELGIRLIDKQGNPIFLED